jgi:DNA-binding GntR family transcriptional regulator
MPRIQTTGEDTYRQLRRLVIEGEFNAGQRLVEADLVEALQVPRMAVRQALGRLEHEGLLEKRAGSSATVRQVSLEELEEIIEARIALESLAIRRAAEVGDPAVLAGLNAVLLEMERAASLPDIPTFVDVQAQLHHLLLGASGMQVVPRLIDSLAALSAQTRVRTALIPNRMRSSLAEHREIIGALARGDADAAEAAVRTHLANVKLAIHQSMSPR